MPVDLEPATRKLSAIVEHIPDRALDDPTPCDMPVAALLDHVALFAVVFTEAANKDTRRTEPRPPDPANLAPDWRTAIRLSFLPPTTASCSTKTTRFTSSRSPKGPNRTRFSRPEA